MKYRLFLFALLSITTHTIFAQDEITDEDLKKYAVTMDSINGMKETLLEDIVEMVKENESMSNERYNQLSKIASDDAKLTAAKATPEEIAFIREVVTKKDEGTAKISETFQMLAKEYIGAASYNKVKKALASDSEVKSRYEVFMKELETDDVN